MSPSRPYRLLLAILALTAMLLPAAATAGSSSHHPARHRRAAHTRHGCANADTRAVNAYNYTMRAAVLCLINRQRTDRGLPSLQENGLLDRSAQGWSNTMVSTGSFTHGSDFSVRISNVGFNWSSAGENIATGYPTPRSVVTAWMASTGHCQNILSPSYADVGTGVNRHPVAPLASDPSTWTQDFALPMGQSAPSGNWGAANGCPY